MTDKPTYSSAELVAWDREFLWHPFTPMKAWVENKDIVVIERGEGEWLIDTQGRRYLDGTSSLWCNVHGHAVPELDEAVREQLGKIAHTTLLGLASPPSILLAKKLVELMRARSMTLEKVFYSDDGSTAVEVACKMAYQFWRNAKRETRNAKPEEAEAKERKGFIAFENGYHGDTVGAVSVGGIEAFHSAFRGLCFPVEFIRWDSSTGLNGLMFQLEYLLEHEAYAGVIVEPLIQGAGGMRKFPAGALAGMRDLCRQYNTLLIADEVLTGFGRTGKMFACEHEGVTPDLMCLSKGLTGGYMPLGATLCTRRIYDAFYADPREGKTFYHGHTFTGHPLACAVALRSIELMEKRGLVERANRLGEIMQEELRVLEGHRHVRRWQRVGLIGAVEVGDGEGGSYPAHWRVGGALCTWMRGRGMMLRPLGDVIVVMPPLTIREENLRDMCKVVVESLTRIEEIVAAKAGEFRA